MKSVEEQEDEFFEEDKKETNITVIITVIVVVALIIAALVFLFFNINKKQNNTSDTEVLEKVIEYSEEEVTDTEDNKDIIDRNAVEEASDEPEMEEAPTETPMEDVIPDPIPQGPIMELDVKDYSKVKYDIKQNLSEMEGYFNDNNLEALDDLAHLERFIAMSYAYAGTTDFAYFGDVNSDGKPDGQGIAVYADNQYYCGSWSNGVREGSGVWVHYHIHLKENLTDPVTFHEFIGNFHNDLPNGDGQDHYEYDSNLMLPNNDYITNYMGNYTNGLIDGDFYCTTLDKTGNYLDFNGSAKHGSFDYVSSSKDDKKRGPVMINATNPDSYYWMTDKDNRNIGVSNYISEYK